MGEPQEIMNLLARLSSVDQNRESDAEAAYEKIIHYINHELSDLLDSSSFPNKSSVKAKLDALLERIHLFVRYPYLYGRTTIGIWAGKGIESRNFIRQLQNGHHFPPCANQRNCPYIIYNDHINNHIFATNQAGNVIQLSIHEYEIAAKQLYTVDIDNRDLIQSYSFSASLKHELINFVVLPRYANTKSAEYKHIADLCSFYFIIHEYTLDYSRLPDAICCSGLPLCLVSEANDPSARDAYNYLTEIYPHRKIRLLSPEEAVAACDSYNHAHHNFFFTDQLLEILLPLKIHQHAKLKKHSENVELLNRGTYDAEDVKDTISALRNTESELKDFEDKMTRQIECSIQTLLELAADLDNALSISVPAPLLDRLLEPEATYLPAHQRTEANIVLGALEANDISTADKYLRRMESHNNPLASICRMYRSEGSGIAGSILLLSAKEHLLHYTEDDDLIVRRAMIHFAEKLQIPASMRDELASHLPQHICNAEELYCAACHKERIGDIQQAYSLYETAFRKGSRPAGERLVDYYLEKNDTYRLKHLADALIPKAAFEYGRWCQDSKFAQFITYLRIAVVLQYTPAILFYSGYLYQTAINERKSMDISAAISLLSYMDKKGHRQNDTVAKLGVLYFMNDQYPLAKQCFERNHSLPEASYYFGCMYFYGQSVSRDYNLAEKYLLEAKALGYSEANKLLAVIRQDRASRRDSIQSRRSVQTGSHSGAQSSTQSGSGRQKDSDFNEQNRSFHAYDEDKDYHSSESRSSSSDEGCFITTATCKSQGKPDDCDELSAFRKYRDEILRTTPEGQALIAEYYRIAPGIVDKISQEPNANEIYRFLYDKYIRPGYLLLQQGKGDEAKRLYTEGVLMLTNQYEVKITSTMKADEKLKPETK